MIYPARLPAWLASMMLAAALFAMLACWELGRQPVPYRGAVMLVVLLLGCALPAWVFVDSGYLLSDDELQIRNGPVRASVPLQRIARVVAGSDSAGAGLPRVLIELEADDAVLVSPKDRNRFLRDLQARRTAVAARNSRPAYRRGPY